MFFQNKTIVTVSLNNFHTSYLRTRDEAKKMITYFFMKVFKNYFLYYYSMFKRILFIFWVYR